jgi:hypothetical protein
VCVNTGEVKSLGFTSCNGVSVPNVHQAALCGCPGLCRMQRLDATVQQSQQAGVN